ncbi:hypothetical protein, partial [Leifsonia sp. SIMBA_070]|uniref:hypothetical protein n=1 Tax=Leifsonia sp. SIMBA_070 TaxID=3085810 RepID=UPI00397D84A5
AHRYPSLAVAGLDLVVEIVRANVRRISDHEVCERWLNIEQKICVLYPLRGNLNRLLTSMSFEETSNHRTTGLDV